MKTWPIVKLVSETNHLFLQETSTNNFDLIDNENIADTELFKSKNIKPITENLLELPNQSHRYTLISTDEYESDDSYAHIFSRTIKTINLFTKKELNDIDKPIFGARFKIIILTNKCSMKNNKSVFFLDTKDSENFTNPIAETNKVNGELFFMWK